MNYKELYSRVLFRLNSPDEGRALLAAKFAVNDALKVIARVQDFDELKVLDTTNAETVVDQKEYSLTDDLGLTRPKDIYTIRLINGSSSRKLGYKPPREWDEVVPYPEGLGSSTPTVYTRRGGKIELYPIPSDVYPLYVFYSQWPAELVDDNDEPEFEDLDDVIIALGMDIATASLEGYSSDWTTRAVEYLSGSVKEDRSRPDREWVARPFNPSGVGWMGEYWKDPFVKRVR